MTHTREYLTAKLLDKTALYLERGAWSKSCRFPGQPLYGHLINASYVVVDTPDLSGAPVLRARALRALGQQLGFEDDGDLVSQIFDWEIKQRDKRKLVRNLRTAAHKVRRGIITV